MGGARGVAGEGGGGQLPPVPSYLPPGCPPLVRIMTLGVFNTGVFNFL